MDHGKTASAMLRAVLEPTANVPWSNLGTISENGMSASIELLRAVQKSDLRICEVPISCKYADTVGVKTSTENPAKHGIGLLMSLIKLVVEDRPSRYFLEYPA